MEFDLTQLTKMYEAETPRSFTIRTGMKGMEMLNLAIEKANNKDHAEFLCTTGLLTSEQKDTVIQMINSSDSENYEVAKVILDAVTKKLPTLKPNQDVSHIQIRKPQVRKLGS